jgi:hypothetical protein
VSQEGVGLEPLWAICVEWFPILGQCILSVQLRFYLNIDVDYSWDVLGMVVNCVKTRFSKASS